MDRSFFFSLRSFIRVYLSQTDTYAGKQDLKCSGEMKFHFGLVEAKFKDKFMAQLRINKLHLTLDLNLLSYLHSS